MVGCKSRTSTPILVTTAPSCLVPVTDSLGMCREPIIATQMPLATTLSPRNNQSKYKKITANSQTMEQIKYRLGTSCCIAVMVT